MRSSAPNNQLRLTRPAGRLFEIHSSPSGPARSAWSFVRSALRYQSGKDILQNKPMMLTALKTFSRILLMAAILNSFVFSDACSQESVTPEQFTQDFDYLWSQLRDNYAYFVKKETDWNRVKDVYRPKVAEVGNQREFITLLESVLDELYDPHTHLKVKTKRSTRLIPTGLDVWAEWKSDKAIITQLRTGFSAEQAGLKVDMEIISINDVPVETAVRNRLGVSLKRMDEAARSWALRALLAGAPDTKRVIEAKNGNGVKATFKLDLNAQTTVDKYQDWQKIE